MEDPRRLETAQAPPKLNDLLVLSVKLHQIPLVSYTPQNNPASMYQRPWVSCMYLQCSILSTSVRELLGWALLQDIHIHIYIRTYMQYIPTCVRMYTHTHIHTYTHTHTYLHPHIHTYMHACMHTYINTYTHTHMHTHAHAHAHAHTHTHTFIRKCMLAFLHVHSYTCFGDTSVSIARFS